MSVVLNSQQIVIRLKLLASDLNHDIPAKEISEINREIKLLNAILAKF